MPRRLIMPVWYRRHSHVWAYLLLAVVTVTALAREEQLRHREAEHFQRATTALTDQAHTNCVSQNKGRVEGNSRADALRTSLLLDVRILSDAAKSQSAEGQEVAAQQLRDRAADFQRLADDLPDLPPIRCKV